MTGIEIIEEQLEKIQNKINEYKSYNEFIKKYGEKPSIIDIIVLMDERRLLKEIKEQ